jgi:glycosyltransferase involved in cell wall biosynthesis
LKLGLIWAQFAAYHVDRCEAVARRLGERAEVLAIEVATTSSTYAWEPSGAIRGAEKITLFPDRSFDTILAWRRFVAMLRIARRCDVVGIGLSYGLADVILLSWTLRLLGRRVVIFSESKFDDKPRSIAIELCKRAILACYASAVVGGRRHADYFRFLGFRGRPVLPGYDGVSVERIRAQAALTASSAKDPGLRPFVYVGRFVDKKNLPTLLRGYSAYTEAAGEQRRPLVLVGSGAEEAAMRELVRELGLDRWVVFAGFLSAEAVSRALADAIALVLVSSEEQWGLVVNEALAVDLPVIVSNEVGARDLLVRNFQNGFVVESCSPQSIGAAMLRIGSDADLRESMARQSRERAWMGDADRLADALEVLLFPGSADARGRIARLIAEMEIA